MIITHEMVSNKMKIFNSFFMKIKKIGIFIHKYRYVYALIFFILGLSFNLHGSSISNWNNFGLSETSDHAQGQTINDLDQDNEVIDYEATVKNWISIPPREDGTIAGVPRMIRTDEWLVQTPFYLAQANSGNQFINPNYALSGQNMVVAYNAPVWHISAIGKPFNWGFLLLGAEAGLSWYWCFKILAMLLLSYEFSLILTRKNKLLSSIGAFWITFTPAIQWWFMQHLGDVVFYTLLMLVSMYHFFHQNNRWLKLFLAGSLGSSIIGFVLVIYPAFQIPFAYLIAFFFLYQLILAIRDKRIHLFDWLVMTATLVFSVSILGLTLWQSRDALILTLNTVYPGSRVSVGGEVEVSLLIEFLYNIFLPFKIPRISNQVELASSFQFVPLFALALPFLLQKDKIKDNLFGIFLVVYTLLLSVYSFVAIPEVLSKLTLFSFVTSSRSWQAAAVIGVFASIWFIGLLWSGKVRFRWPLFLNMLPILSLYSFLVINEYLDIHYIARTSLIIMLAIYGFVFVLFLFKQKIAPLLLFVLILVSGMTVNPIVMGLDVIEEKVLAKNVETIKSRDEEALWMTDNTPLYHLPQMVGVKSIDGVRFYPDVQLMKKLDPSDEQEKKWNRYSHMRYLLTNDKTMMENPAPDIVSIQLNVDDLEELGVKYIISNRNLSELFGSDRFKEIYGPDQDGHRIFEFAT